MDVFLSVIGIAFLMVLMAISWSKQRQEKRVRVEAQGLRHSPDADAQHKESMRRRAEVRAAHAERVRVDAPTEASDTDA
jgi:hypothetical protein